MIDVIIPAYNCSKTLDRALSSLVIQTDKNFVVTIVDDCSTEDIRKIVESYQTKLDIRYIRNQKNLGCGMSRQVGIDNTDKNFVTFLDSDDTFMPYTIQLFNQVIDINPDVPYIHSHFYQQLADKKLYMHTTNYTATHGKVYNVSLLKKYDIHNSPDVLWADDSYFNAMCNGLFPITTIKLPTMIWLHNQDSVLNCKNSYRDKNSMLDFLKGMLKAGEFLVKNNGNISHVKNSAKQAKMKKKLNKTELAVVEKILQLQSLDITHDNYNKEQNNGK